MKFCDLHIHSTHSDGSYTPFELVKYAKEKGLSAIALTDHNTKSGILEFENACIMAEMEYALGSELTTEYNGHEVHLLCLFINEECEKEINEFIAERKRNKKKSNIALEKNLIEGGYDISLEKMKKIYCDNINRAHFARELVNGGYVSSTTEAFNTILRDGGEFYKSIPRPDVIDTIKQVSSWGCATVIAHPLLNFEKEELDLFLEEARKAGLDGIEVYYPQFNEEQKEFLLSLTKKHGLIASGGSDFHGSMKDGVDLGTEKVPYSSYEALKAKSGLKNLKS